MRAREPDIEGYVERRGVKVGYEVFGDGDPTILLLPRGRSCTPGPGRRRSRSSPGATASSPIDPRGNGRSDRPTGGGVLVVRRPSRTLSPSSTPTGTDAAIVVGLSMAGGTC